MPSPQHSKRVSFQTEASCRIRRLESSLRRITLRRHGSFMPTFVATAPSAKTVSSPISSLPKSLNLSSKFDLTLSRMAQRFSPAFTVTSQLKLYCAVQRKASRDHQRAGYKTEAYAEKRAGNSTPDQNFRRPSLTTERCRWVDKLLGRQH